MCMHYTAGGFLENIVFGYSGVWYQEDALQLSPTLPPLNVTSLVIRGLSYCAGSITVGVNDTHIWVQRVSGPSMTVTDSDEHSYALVSGGDVVVVPGNQTLWIALGKQPGYDVV